MEAGLLWNEAGYGHIHFGLSPAEMRGRVMIECGDRRRVHADRLTPQNVLMISVIFVEEDVVRDEQEMNRVG